MLPKTKRELDTINILPNWHPIFVHFTVALLIVAAGMHLLSHFVTRPELRNQLTIAARWNLWIGIAATLLTVAAGWYAFNTVKHDEPSHLAMIEHRNWAMSTLAVFLTIAAWEYYLYRHGKGKGWLFTALLVIAASLLLSTAWHGGELVYRYGLGVMSLPKPEGAGHAHDHGGNQGGMDHGAMDHSEMPVSAVLPAGPAHSHSHDEMPESAVHTHHHDE